MRLNIWRWYLVGGIAFVAGHELLPVSLARELVKFARSVYPMFRRAAGP